MSDQNDTSHYEGALLEDINSKFDALLEGQAALAKLPDDVKELKQDVHQLQQDVAVIKAVVTDQSRDIKALDRRVGRLEKVIA